MSITLSRMRFENGRLCFDVSTGFVGVPSELYFSVSSEHSKYVNVSYDCALVAILPLALYLGEDIYVNGKVDIDLYENIQEAKSQFHAWYPKTTKEFNIFVDECTVSSIERKPSVMSFYSGGVDSLFNIAGRVKCGFRKVNACVLVHGMDVPLDNIHLWNNVKSSLSDNISSISELEMVAVETNARSFQPQGVDWTSTGFGPILGAIGNFLSKGFGYSIIGSYGLYRELMPHASGPLIDRLWSSSRVSVLHFSPRFNRLEKIESIKNSYPGLLKHLRVCWKNPGGKYNCGVCEKCLRTKSELLAAGADHLTEAFGQYVLENDLKLLKGQIPADDYTAHFWEDLVINIEDEAVVKRIREALLHSRLFRYPNMLTSKIKKLVKGYLKARSYNG